MSASILKVQNINISSNQKIIGFILVFITIFIWAIYFLSLRISSLSTLSLEELSLFRYAIPGILLFPVFIKSFKDYKKVPLIYLLGIIIGSGLLFFLLSAYAMGLTPVVYGSTLVPGTTPLFVSLIAVLIYKQELSSIRKWGLVCIISGIVVMLIQVKSETTLNTNLLLGESIFILCALLWAFFTISIRQASLPAIKVAALAAFPNAMLIIIYTLINQTQFTYMNLELSEVLIQVFVQGILVGIISGMCFSAAIARIGAEKAAAFGALTPALATFLASVYLHEALSFTLLLAVFLIIIGVCFSSGIFNYSKLK